MGSIYMGFSLLALIMIAAPAAGQTVEAPTAVAVSPSVSSTIASATPGVLPAGTIVHIEIGRAMRSDTVKRGERFPIRLAEDVVLDGKVILAAGLQGEGEVVHADHSKMAGRPGELLLAARYLEVDGVQAPLRSLKFGASGNNNTNAAMAVAFVAGPLAVFVEGGEVVIPPNTRARAKLAAPYPAAGAGAAPPSAPVKDTQEKASVP